MTDKTNSNNASQEKIKTSLTKNHTDFVKNQSFEEDFDLFDIIINLWKQKLIILSSIFIFTLLSFMYANKQKNIYEAEILLLPAKFDKITSASDENGPLNKKRKEYSIGYFRNYRNIFENLFLKFKQNLTSRKMQKEFIVKNKLIKNFNESNKLENMEFFETFASKIKIKNETLYAVSYTSHNPHIASETINNFIDFINKKTVDTLKEVAQKRIDEEIIDIENAINSKREIAKRRREDQIIRFQEAKIIAESLGFKRRVDATNIIQSTSKMSADIASATTPLYYIGTKAISAEISILKNRVTDDPFIIGLRDLQEELSKLTLININNMKLNAVKIDQSAYPSTNPIYPDKIKIVLFGILIGLFSGVIFAFIRIFFQINIRKRI